jgi:hypothetical protein
LFGAGKLLQFWLLVKNNYPSLSEKQVKVLLHFVTTYLHETPFSAVSVKKTKYRPLFIIQKELRAAIFLMIPPSCKLCAEKSKSIHMAH